MSCLTHSVRLSSRWFPGTEMFADILYILGQLFLISLYSTAILFFVTIFGMIVFFIIGLTLELFNRYGRNK